MRLAILAYWIVIDQDNVRNQSIEGDEGRTITGHQRDGHDEEGGGIHPNLGAQMILKCSQNFSAAIEKFRKRDRDELHGMEMA